MGSRTRSASHKVGVYQFIPVQEIPIPIKEISHVDSRNFPCRSMKLPCRLLKESNSEQSALAGSLEVFNKVWADNQTAFGHSMGVVVDGRWHQIPCVANGRKSDLDSDAIARLMHRAAASPSFMAFHQRWVSRRLTTHKSCENSRVWDLQVKQQLRDP